MVGAIIHQLTRNLKDSQIEDSAFAPYFVDHTAGVYPTAASGFPFSAASIAVKGDPIADLTEDLAADATTAKEQPAFLKPENRWYYWTFGTSDFFEKIAYLQPYKNNMTSIYTSFYKIRDRTSCFHRNEITPDTAFAPTWDKQYRGCFIIILMTAVSAAVTAATVIAAGVAHSVMMVVVVALSIRIKIQASINKCLHSLVRITAYTAIQLNTSLSQSHLCTATDAAANENICVHHGKKSCQCTVAAAVGIYHFFAHYLSILYLVDLKLRGMTKVLKNFTVFISHCNFHKAISLSNLLSDFLN